MTLRVLMVTAAYLPSVGGIETHVHEVSRRLVRAGLGVTVLATDPTGHLPGHERLDGIEVRRVRAFPANRDWRFAPGLDEVIGSQAWDLVHCQGYHTFVAPMAMFAARRRGIPYLTTLHSGGPVSGLRLRVRGMQLLALRPLLMSARVVVAVSDFERALFAHRLHLSVTRFRVIPNGAELPVPDPQPLASPRSGPRIVSVGRLVPYKGHQRAIEAMPAVLARCPGATLQVVGAGPYEEELKRKVHLLGLDASVSFDSIPGSDRQAMANAMGWADVVVLLSEYESQGIAAFEALSLGRRLVVSDTSAFSELGRAGRARAIPLNATPRETADAILAEALAGPQTKSAPTWTWDDCSSALAGVYCSMTESAAS